MLPKLLFLFNFLLISHLEITTACLALPNHMAATREDVKQQHIVRQYSFLSNTFPLFITLCMLCA